MPVWVIPLISALFEAAKLLEPVIVQLLSKSKPKGAVAEPSPLSPDDTAELVSHLQMHSNLMQMAGDLAKRYQGTV